MKIQFTWPDYLIPFVTKTGAENTIDLFINSLLLENDQDEPRRITRIVFDLCIDGQPIWRWELPQQALWSHLEIGSNLGQLSKMERQNLIGKFLAEQIETLTPGPTLKPGETALIRRFPVRFTCREVPNELVTRVYSGTHLIGRNSIPLDAFNDDIGFGFPVEGTWQITNNFDNTIVHRTCAPQEFAIDLVQLNETGTLVSKPGEDPGLHNCFGQSVMAMANGQITQIAEGMPDNDGSLELNEADNESRIKKHGFIHGIAGNYVQIKHTDKRYSFYAHLRHGTVSVKVGDTVKRGTILGEVGNSGYSLVPHLHVHMNDGPNPLGNRSVPIKFDNIFDMHNQAISFIKHNRSVIHTR